MTLSASGAATRHVFPFLSDFQSHGVAPATVVLRFNFYSGSGWSVERIIHATSWTSDTRLCGTSGLATTHRAGEAQLEGPNSHGGVGCVAAARPAARGVPQ